MTRSTCSYNQNSHHTVLFLQSEEDRQLLAVLQRSLEAAVQLEAFPKSVVNINCVVMEAAGSEPALLITAASLALADAGIPMFDLVTACFIVSTCLLLLLTFSVCLHMPASPLQLHQFLE